MNYLLELSDKDILKKVKEVKIDLPKLKKFRIFTPKEWINSKEMFIDLQEKGHCIITVIKKLKYSV